MGIQFAAANEFGNPDHLIVVTPVDGGMVPHLPDGWTTGAASAMRHKEIYVHDRTMHQLRRLNLSLGTAT